MAFQCGTPGLLETYREKKGPRKEIPLDGGKFFADVHAGDPAAMETLVSFSRAVAVQAYNLTSSVRGIQHVRSLFAFCRDRFDQ